MDMISAEKWYLEIKNVLACLAYTNLVEIPTRVSSASATLLDTCLSNININEIQDGVLSVDLWDDFPAVCFADTKLEQVAILVKECFGVEEPVGHRSCLETLSEF